MDEVSYFCILFHERLIDATCVRLLVPNIDHPGLADDVVDLPPSGISTGH